MFRKPTKLVTAKRFKSVSKQVLKGKVNNTSASELGFIDKHSGFKGNTTSKRKVRTYPSR